MEKLNRKIISLTLLSLASCDTCPTVVEMDKSYKLNCIVDSLFDNPRNRFAPTIRLACDANDDKIIDLDGYYYPCLLESASLGDSVSKEANTLRFVLKKKDTSYRFFPVCDGKEIK